MNESIYVELSLSLSIYPKLNEKWIWQQENLTYEVRYTQYCIQKDGSRGGILVFKKIRLA